VLRATVRRYGACLGQLPPLERRVLVLRAALGRSEPRSRVRVAALTATSVGRVARAERRGLHRLRALGRRGGCAVLAPATLVYADAGYAQTPLPALPGLGAPAPSAPTPHSGVKSEHASGRVARAPAAAALPLVESAPVPRQIRHGGGAGLTVVIVPLVLLGFLAYAVRAERRRRVV
jgi:hypothetical protein